MSAFIIVAACMAAIAAALVAVPLMRDKKSRLIGAVAALLVAAAAAGLYPLWSNWDWHAPVQAQETAAAPQVLAMVAKLEQHLRDDPNDLAGWLMLGRSYLALQRMDDAVSAYDRAHRLDAKSVEATLGLGESISLRAGGQISAQAMQLFEEGLTLAPNNPKALLYGGFAAATRGDTALARSRWQALKELHPPPQIEQMLDARIAALGPAESGTNASAAGTSASSEGSAEALVTVNIHIAPALKSRLKPETPLFVFAREPDSRGPPLAAKRLTSDAIGTQIRLSAADSMMPGRVLVAGKRVSVTARVSFSGRPVPTAGDLYGELSYDVGHDGPLDLTIDRIAE